MGAIVVILILAAMVGLSMLFGALLIGIVAAMFLDLPFQHGWDQAWDNKGYLLLFIFLILPIFAGRD